MLRKYEHFFFNSDHMVVCSFHYDTYRIARFLTTHSPNQSTPPPSYVDFITLYTTVCHLTLIVHQNIMLDGYPQKLLLSGVV